MKKKLLFLLSAMLVVFSLAACSGSGNGDKTGQGDFEAFLEVQKNMQAVRDMEFKMDMDMTAVTDVSLTEGTDMSVKMSGTGKEVVNSSGDIEMELACKMDIPGLGAEGGGLDSTIYMKDKAVYMDVMGQKLKVDASNEMAAAMNLDTADLLAITEDMVSNLSVTRKGADTVYAFDLDADKALNYFEKNAGASKLAALDEADVTFEKMRITVTADEKQMAKRIDMDCKMTAGAQETASNISYKLSMEYLSLNSGLKITFPDFSDYQELTV